MPRAFWVLFVGTLINRTGGFVLIFLAIYLIEVRGLSAAQAGATVSAYGLGAIGAAPLGGALSDRIGRRPTLVASLIAGGASMFVLGLSTTPETIAIAAVVTGLLYEMYRPVVNAAVADLVPAEGRARAYSLIYWAVNLGAACAGVLGGVIAARSYRALFVLDAITTATFGVLLWAALPETRPTQQGGDRRQSSALKLLVRDGVFVSLCVLSFMLFLVFFQGFVGLPIDVRAHNVSTIVFGRLMALNGVLIVLLQLPLTEMIRRRSRTRVLAVASLLIGLGFGLNGWVQSVAAYAVGVVIWTIGEILFTPAAMSLVADLAPADARGLYQGAFGSAFTAAFAAAPIAGGWMIAHAGAGALWTACLVVGTVVAVGFFVMRRAERRYEGLRKSPT